MNLLNLAAGAVALSLIAGGAVAHNHAGDKQDDSHHGMHQNMGHDDKAGAEGHGHHDVVVGTGTVKGLDAAKGTVKLAHDPIPALKWPAMVMDFKVAKDVDLGSLSAGQQVEFALGQDRPSPPSSRRADGPLPPRFLSIRDQVPRAKPGT